MSRRFFGQLHPQQAVFVKYFVTVWACLIIPILAMGAYSIHNLLAISKSACPVITTVIQSFITSDPHILSIDRKVRLVGSCFMVLLPFIPIPIVLVVLALKAASPGGLSKSEKLAEADDDTEANMDESHNHNGNSANHTEKPARPSTTSDRIKGEPKTGFGPTPVGEKEILETALVILIPAALLTFEQGVRCAQAFHVPKPGEKTPWVRVFCALVMVFGTDRLTVYD
jgi:hypothetical protein